MQSWWSQGARLWSAKETESKMEDSRRRFSPPAEILWPQVNRSETEQIENKFSRARHGMMYILENKPCETTCQNRFAMAMNFNELSEAFLNGYKPNLYVKCIYWRYVPFLL